jgi:hypothetical protein
MSKSSRASPGKHTWINEGTEKEYFASSKGTKYQELSFLSLNEAVNRYPDTGESGDAYDIEATVDS